jgi:hypothetical protein
MIVAMEERVALGHRLRSNPPSRHVGVSLTREGRAMKRSAPKIGLLSVEKKGRHRY